MLKLAYVAATSSHDPSSQNGALIVRGHDDGSCIIARGRNHVPDHPDVDAILADRGEKYAHVIHAEVDAITDAARRGVSTLGATMVCPWASCLGCAAVIIRAGITRLVTHKQRIDLTHGAWVDEVGKAERWLREAGVEVICLDGAVDAPPILVNGEEWQP